jgi:contractile injection system tube protein
MMALEKAVITNTDTGKDITVMFNPSDYTLTRDINYAQAAVPGLSAPIIQFVNGNVPTLEMELFLDTYETNISGGRTLNHGGDDVRKLVSQVTGLMDINPETHAPPILLFTWASLTFTCVLAKASQKFVMFLPDGTPVRARIQVTFHGFSNGDIEPKEVKRQTADYSRMYVIADGDTLSTIAARVYRNAALWRPIGIVNGVADPLVLTPGMRLLVVQLPFTDPETGEVIQ